MDWIIGIRWATNYNITPSYYTYYFAKNGDNN